MILLIDNKRLDEWVEESRLDLRKIQYPRKDITTTCSTAINTGGLNTPTKTPANQSRPSSPGTPHVRLSLI